MMASYAQLAYLLSRLQESGARPEKAARVAAFLRGLPPDQICPGLRLLTGELWPPWESTGPGVGIGLLVRTLSTMAGREAVSLWQAQSGEPGNLSGIVRQHLSQSALCPESLSLITVYSELRRLSMQWGPGSLSRKESILKGLFTNCTELEACYLARTAVRSSGWQPDPRLLSAAISRAFSVPEPNVWSAYCWQPDLGRVAQAALSGELSSLRLIPRVPCREMRITFCGQLPAQSGGQIYLARRRGLRVQVHISPGSARIFTSRRWEVSSSLPILADALRGIGRTAVLEGELLGFRGGLLPLSELVRFLNRRHQARRSPAGAGLVVWDLLYLDGSDLTGRPYQDRWDRLAPLLYPTDPGPGQVVMARRMTRAEAEQALASGGHVMVRDGGGLYLPGARGADAIVRGHESDRCCLPAGGDDT